MQRAGRMCTTARILLLPEPLKLVSGAFCARIKSQPNLPAKQQKFKITWLLHFTAKPYNNRCRADVFRINYVNCAPWKMSFQLMMVIIKGNKRV